MKNNDRKVGRTSAAGAVLPTNAQEFAESLERRRQAADGLEKDLLNDVPVLYGSPEVGPVVQPPQGDPGVILARIHREEMLRRNGYDVSDASGAPSEVSLPFERTTTALAVILFLIAALFEKLT